MFCTQCGARNPDDGNFCHKCGGRLRARRPMVDVDDQLALQPVDEEKVSRLLDRAFELYDTGNVDQAFEVCRAALRLNPDSVTGHSLMSTVYEKRGDLDAAIRQMERVVEMNPDSTADVNRLEALRHRARLARAEEPLPVPTQSGEWVSHLAHDPRVLAGAGIAATVLFAVVLFHLRGGQDTDNPALPPTPPAATVTTTAARPGSVFPPNTRIAPTVSGSVFDGLDVADTQAPPSAPPPAPPRSQEPDAEVSAPAPSRAQPSAPPVVSVPAPAPRPAPAITPKPSEGSISITRSGPSSGNGAAPTTGNGVQKMSGREYQNMAMDYKKAGDRTNAIASFTKAIQAFRAEAGQNGKGFEAQQGIRSCEIELRLLGESD